MRPERISRTSSDTLLRLRSYAQAELERTPSHLFPLLNESLRMAIDDINAELADRAWSAGLYVRLVPEYDDDARLEDVLRPLPGPRWPSATP